jgi:glycosyltransferase involved in cell wall biosynthesis
MIVLHVVISLSGSGGAEQGLVREITHFDGSTEHLVLRLFEPDDLEPSLVSIGVRVEALGLASRSSSWTWPDAARRVRRYIRSFQPDIVQSTLFVGNLVGQLAAAGTSVPVLSTLTLTGDERLHKELQPGAGTWKAATLRRVAAFAGRRRHVWYRALTNDAARTNCGLMGLDRSRIFVIPRGVRVERVLPDRMRFGIPEGVPLVVNVARLAAQKGQQYLVRSFRRIKDQLPHAHLVIAGREGDAAVSVRAEISALGLEDSIHLLGYTADVPVLLASADLFLFSSLAEGLGTAVLEALAIDLPVVAFDIPPIREVTDQGRYARLTPVKDADRMAKASVEILNGRRGPRSSAWVRDQYAIEHIAHKVQNTLERVVASRSGNVRD